MVMLKAELTVWGLAMVLKIKWSSGPELTVKELLVPVLPPPEAVIVAPVPDAVNVKEPDH